MCGPTREMHQDVPRLAASNSQYQYLDIGQRGQTQWRCLCAHTHFICFEKRETRAVEWGKPQESVARAASGNGHRPDNGRQNQSFYLCLQCSALCSPMVNYTQCSLFPDGQLHSALSVPRWSTTIPSAMYRTYFCS
ncbi:hypothetical protein DPX16_16512 [Anabarilius grahami]|uniref:Uncharacterized protein n=1 Tax=Anabarilius grahami TaxID=495550 RepID=A0A3N0XUY1_ANAGA|nr:hypothetical protein DPX16_16512 [Anabarilius grahami]